VDCQRAGCRRRRGIALGALTCAVALAACGSSTDPNSTSGRSSASFPHFAVCMRSHGVPSYPDAISAGQGGAVGLVPSSPAFKAAWAACDRWLPGLGRHQPVSALAMAQMRRFSKCMRSHGVTGFPDPTPSPPANPGGFSLRVRRGGAYLSVPDTIDPAAPGYTRAAAACRFGPVFS
jgi:hypothetical protein